MHFEVIKIHETKNSTISRLLVDGQFFGFIPEDGFRAVKVAGATRIPDGTYDIIKRTYGKFFNKYKKQFGHKFVPEIANVPNYTDILIHIGNTVQDTRGCVCPNKKCGFDSDKQLFFGESSTDLYCTIYLMIDAAFAKNEPVKITLKRDQDVTH